MSQIISLAWANSRRGETVFNGKGENNTARARITLYTVLLDDFQVPEAIKFTSL